MKKQNVISLGAIVNKGFATKSYTKGYVSVFPRRSRLYDLVYNPNSSSLKAEITDYHSGKK